MCLLQLPLRLVQDAAFLRPTFEAVRPPAILHHLVVRCVRKVNPQVFEAVKSRVIEKAVSSLDQVWTRIGDSTYQSVM